MTGIDLILTRGYAQQALVAAIAIGLVCSLLSVVVVLKRMAFIGQGISHAGFGGVGTAVLLGYSGEAYRWHQDAVVFIFCLLTALFIGGLTRRKRVQADTAIGIVLAATMAWGVIAMNLWSAWQTWPAFREWIGDSGRPRSWESILFGSMFNVGAPGMWLAIAMAVGVIAVCAAFYKELLFYTFDETVSVVYGVRSTLIHYLLLVVLSVVVVVSIRLVGLVLVSALLIMPGAAAMLMSRRLHVVLGFAAIFGVLSAAGGLWLALQAGDLAPGACIVLILAAFFALSYLASRLASAAHRSKTPVAAG